MGSCYINSALDARRGCDGAFMGTTHALSAVALFLVLAAFLPQHVAQVLGSDNIWVLVLALAVVAGASLIPDLDNTASTSKSSLGLLGDGLSVIFRSTSAVIQTAVRTKRDDPDPNPHRGFYHTVPACLLLGVLVLLGTKIPGSATLPLLGELRWGAVFALVVAWLSVHMALAGLAKDLMKSLKKKAGLFGELVTFTLSLLLTTALFLQLPKELDYWWLGVSVAAGCLIHILGDCFTTAGNPILFPFPHRGKLWWTVRFLPIKAGGVVERFVFMPFFAVVCLVSLLKVSGLFGLLA